MIEKCCLLSFELCKLTLYIFRYYLGYFLKCICIHAYKASSESIALSISLRRSSQYYWRFGTFLCSVQSFVARDTGWGALWRSVVPCVVSAIQAYRCCGFQESSDTWRFTSRPRLHNYLTLWKNRKEVGILGAAS